MSDGLTIAAAILREGDEIAREKNGKALTESEANKLRAAAFLRKIAPYLANDAVARIVDDQHEPTPRA